MIKLCFLKIHNLGRKKQWTVNGESVMGKKCIHCNHVKKK